MASASLVSVPIHQLVRSKLNMRRTGRDHGIEGLAASIAAHGLRQNLSVRPTTGNRYEVVAGGRRLEALKRLVKDGQLARDVEVPCMVLAEGESATELSLVENAVRLDAHPDDQARAFATLIEEGFSVDDVAARFGITAKAVNQRLKLASVSPLLRARYRQGSIDTGQMMALALVDDHAVQEAVWDRLPEWNRQPDAIRRALTGEGMSADHRLAKFIGVEAYRAAGGEVIEDLFEEDRAPIFVNADLVQVIAAAKLEETATAIRLEGWSWVKVELTPEYVAYGRVYPSSADDGGAHDEPRFNDEDLARAGARISLGYNGTVTVDRGLVSPDTLRTESRAEGASTPVKKGLSDAMVADLTAHRTAALRLTLARNATVGLASAVHALLLYVLYGPHGQQTTCLELSLRPTSLSVVDPEECTAHQALDDLLAAWRIKIPPHPEDFWAWCLQQDQPTLLDLLALAAGVSVNATSHQQHAAGSRLEHAGRLADALGFDVKDCWRPKATSFFSRLTKALMSTFLRDVGATELAADVLKLTKAAAVERTAEKLIAAGWQPSVFRAPVHTDGSDETGLSNGSEVESEHPPELEEQIAS